MSSKVALIDGETVTQLYKETVAEFTSCSSSVYDNFMTFNNQILSRSLGKEKNKVM